MVEERPVRRRAIVPSRLPLLVLPLFLPARLPRWKGRIDLSFPARLLVPLPCGREDLRVSDSAKGPSARRAGLISGLKMFLGL